MRASFAARQLHLFVVPLLFHQECSLLSGPRRKAHDDSGWAVKHWRLREAYATDGDGSVAPRLPPNAERAGGVPHQPG
jgi:hypothetical protein